VNVPLLKPHLQVGASVHVRVAVAGQVFQLPPAFDFTLGNSVRDMWQGKVRASGGFDKRMRKVGREGISAGRRAHAAVSPRPPNPSNRNVACVEGNTHAAEVWVGGVHHSRAIFCRPAPNRRVTLRIAVLYATFGEGVRSLRAV
jgi:hypothetical protein